MYSLFYENNFYKNISRLESRKIKNILRIMLSLDFISPKFFLFISKISSQRRIRFPKISLILTLSLYLGPTGHVFSKIQLIFGHENLRIFLEYFEAQNADLLRILRLKFCYVILIKK